MKRWGVSLCGFLCVSCERKKLTSRKTLGKICCGQRVLLSPATWSELSFDRNTRALPVAPPFNPSRREPSFCDPVRYRRVPVRYLPTSDPLPTTYRPRCAGRSHLLPLRLYYLGCQTKGNRTPSSEAACRGSGGAALSEFARGALLTIAFSLMRTENTDLFS